MAFAPESTHARLRGNRFEKKAPRLGRFWVHASVTLSCELSAASGERIGLSAADDERMRLAQCLGHVRMNRNVLTISFVQESLDIDVTRKYALADQANIFAGSRDGDRIGDGEAVLIIDLDDAQTGPVV